MFAKDQGKEAVKKTATWQEIGPGSSEFSSRAATKNKSPAALVRIVEALHRVENRRNRLHLVDKHEVGFFSGRQSTADGDELSRQNHGPKEVEGDREKNVDDA